MATTSVTIPRQDKMDKIIHTGIQGLDYILNGGLHIWNGHYPCVIVSGVPGTGKSILSATIACEVFEKRGRSAAYFTLEQKAGDVKTMITQFEWGPATPETALWLDSNCRGKLARSPDEPQFLISHFPMNLLRARAGLRDADLEHAPSERPLTLGESLSQWDVALEKHILSRIKKLHDCGVIVVDSLSDAFATDRSEGAGEFYALRRSLFQRICDLAKRRNALVIVILESRGDLHWRDYVADVVIDLNWQRSEPGGNVRRYAQVKKARFQPIMDGRHEMRIVPTKGIEVYPNQSEVLRRERLGQPPSDGRAEEVCFCVDKGFNRMLGDGVIEGSATLLYGPDATRKNVILARFLQQALQETDGYVLFLPVGITREVARQMICKYLDRAALKAAGQTEKGVMRRMIIQPLTGFDKTPSELLNEVRQILEKPSERLNEVRQIPDDQPAIRRVALDDVAALVSGPDVAFPLKELFVFRGLASLFVHTVNRDEESPIRESFDTVIRARHVQLPNSVSERIGYQVLKFNGATKGQKRSWELRYSEKDGSLQISDAFKEYVEGQDGKLHLLPMRLMVHCEFREFREDWEAPIRAMFGIRDDHGSSDLAIQVFTRKDAEAVLDLTLTMESGYEMPETKVVSFDEYRAGELARLDKLEPLDDLVDQDLLDEFLEGPLRKVCRDPEGRAGVFGLPHHLNFGLYAVRTDLVTDAILRQYGVSWDRPLTWDELTSVAREAQQEYRHRKGTRLIEETGGAFQEIHDGESRLPRCFDYWTRIDESFTSYVLEVLWPFLFRGGRYRGFGDEEVVEAAIRWYQVLEAADSLPSQTEVESEPAIVQRHWVLSYWKMLRDHPELEKSLRIIPAPCLATDASGEARQAASISGNWFLGIVKGSPNPGRGMWAIKALTNKALSRRMYQNRLWLPPHRSLLAAGEGKKLREMHEQSVSRCRIPNYPEARPILIDGFGEIFTQPRRSPAEITNLLTDMQEQMEAIGGQGN